MQQNFQNNQIFDLDIPNFCELVLSPVSPKYLYIILFNTAVFVLFMIAAVSTILYFFYADLDQIQVWAILTGVFVLSVYMVLNGIIGFKFRKYAVREKDLVYQYGWLKRTVKIVPFSRIQHIKVEQGWFSKILQLKTLAVYTAASDGDISIAGLPEEIAEGINNHIRGNVSALKINDGGER